MNAPDLGLVKNAETDSAAIVAMMVEYLDADYGQLTKHVAGQRVERLCAMGPLTLKANQRMHDAAVRSTVTCRGWTAKAGANIERYDHGDRATLALIFQIDEGELLVIAVDRPRQSTNHSAELDAVRVYPIIDSHLRLWRHHHRGQRQAIAKSAALDLSGVATAIIDSSSRLLHANAAMGRLLASGDGLRCYDHDGVLGATDLGSAVRLQIAVRHAIADRAAPGAASPTLLIECRRAKSQGLLVALTAVSGDHANLHGTLIVQALAPGEDVSAEIRAQCALYRPSQVETTLVLHLVGGLALEAAAQAMHIKPDTARSYLKQIFVKTGISRQIDLTRLILGRLMRLETSTIHNV